MRKLVVKKYFDYYFQLIGIVSLILNFVLWNLNYAPLAHVNINIYFYIIIGLAIALLLNSNKINVITFIKENVFFIVIILILYINSFHISFWINGNYIGDVLGPRSRILMLKLIPSFLLILLFFRYFRTKFLRYTFIAIIVLISIYSIIGIYGVLFNVETLFDVYPNKIFGGRARYNSVLNNPNTLGEFTFVGIFMVFYLFLTENKASLKYIYLVFLLPLLGGMYISESRASILMLGILYFAIHIYYKHYPKLLKNLLQFTNLIAIIGLVGLFILKRDFLFNYLRIDFGISGRTELWNYLLNAIREHFIFGVGFNNSTFVIVDAQLADSSAHNMYLGLFLEFGLIAFIITMVWFGYILVTNHIAIIKHKENPLIYYLMPINAFILSFLVGQIFEFSFLRLSALNIFVLFLFATSSRLKASLHNNEDSIDLRITRIIKTYTLKQYELLKLKWRNQKTK